MQMQPFTGRALPAGAAARAGRQPPVAGPDEHLDGWSLSSGPCQQQRADRPSLNAASRQPTVYDRGSWSEHEFLVCEPLAASG
ncbi:MAG: hypothetical protein H6651_15555 [Ardenticatenales bacterium]|nr:hypothetical protein [Ardenticatenales bacterium]